MADFDFGQADEEELQYKSFWERLRESFSKFNNCLRHVIWSNAYSLIAPKRISRGPILFLGTEQIISDILFIIVVAHLHCDRLCPRKCTSSSHFQATISRAGGQILWVKEVVCPAGWFSLCPLSVILFVVPLLVTIVSFESSVATIHPYNHQAQRSTPWPCRDWLRKHYITIKEWTGLLSGSLIFVPYMYQMYFIFSFQVV